MSDIRLQEIMARAVVGRCDRRVVWSHAAPAKGVESVLGVHVSSAEMTVAQGDQGASVRLSAVCEVWCGCGGETRVERLTCTYNEPANVPLSARVVGATETTGSLVRGTRCIGAEVTDGQLQVTLESHISLEATGTARFWVKAYDLADEAEAEGLSDSLSSDSSSSSDLTAEYDGQQDDEGDEEQGDDLATLAATGSDDVAAAEPRRAERESGRSSALARFSQPRLTIVQGH